MEVGGMTKEEVVCVVCHFAVFGLGILAGFILPSLKGSPAGSVSPETRRALDNPATRYRIVDAWRAIRRREAKPKRRAG